MSVTDQQCSTSRHEEAVLVSQNGSDLHGALLVPDPIRGAVILVDEQRTCGMGCNQSTLATQLNSTGFAVLDMELLSREEQTDRRLVSYCRDHIQLLASRVVAATDWLANARRTRDLPIGYFGTGTGAAAALMAAAERPLVVCAIVLSSGRPFLARPALPQVLAPTLLIADCSDSALIQVNRAALSQMRCQKRLEFLPEGSDKSTSLERVARLAKDWFERYLVPPALDS